MPSTATWPLPARIIAGRRHGAGQPRLRQSRAKDGGDPAVDHPRPGPDSQCRHLGQRLRTGQDRPQRGARPA
ncbi:hypothetical protein G6F32_015918 [Rhizopus arrhizus]|nr:hypothetical protein G6F32_015918 [Rhizopus arrhizus]